MNYNLFPHLWIGCSVLCVMLPWSALCLCLWGTERWLEGLEYKRCCCRYKFTLKCFLSSFLWSLDHHHLQFLFFENMFIPIWLVDLANVLLKWLGKIQCLTFYLWSQLVNANAHMLLWLFAFSGWGVWQSRAPGGEHRITGIWYCSHSRDGSLPVTLWMHQQPINMNKLSIPGNVSSFTACCCAPYSAALTPFGKGLE